MTVSTLTYIHELLKEEVRKCEGALELIRKVYREAVDNEQSNVECLEEQKENARKKYNKALDALTDYEAKEW